MAEIKKSVDLPVELTAEILIRGALALEQGESEKVLRGLKKGLEKLIAQKQISNQTAMEFKRIWKKLEENRMTKKEEFVEKVAKVIEEYNAKRQKKAALAKKHDRDKPPLMRFSWAAENAASLEYEVFGKPWGSPSRTFSNFEDVLQFLEIYPVKSFKVVVRGYYSETLLTISSSNGGEEHLFKK